MRKAFIVDIPGSDKSITVTETSNKTSLLFKIGYEEVILPKTQWEELMRLDNDIYLYTEIPTEIPNGDDSWTADNADSTPTDNPASCAQMDWDDNRSSQTQDKES